MRLADTPAALLEQGKALTLNVSPGKSVVVVGKQVQQRSRSGISWAGPLQGENGWATLILTDKGITGTLRSGTPQSGFTFYRFEPIGDDLQAVVRVDASQFPSEHPPEYSTGALHKYSEEDSSRTSHDSTDAKADQNNQVQKEQSSSGGPYIDLLVVYTQAAANATSDINGLIQTTVTETNQSYQNSNIDLETTLAHSSQINYDETGRSYEDHLNTISDFSDGVGENVNDLRNQYEGDIVVLLVDDQEPSGNACGLADDIKANPATAYAVVHFGCALSPQYSFPHEIGHLQGARHDPAVDGSDEPFEYGHGYVDPNSDWRTIMAYVNACNGFCGRVPYWSNPDVNYPPTGQPMGTNADEDNAQVLNRTKDDVRDFRALPSPSNFRITNRYSTGDWPHFEWDAVSDADDYRLYRCVDNDPGDYYSPCTSLYNFYYIGGSTPPSTEASDRYHYKIKKAYTCNSSAEINATYSITAKDDHLGESGFSIKESICVENVRGTPYASEGNAEDSGRTASLKEEATPKEFSLQGNAPNPVTDQTMIHFALPEATHVKLVVYDVRGQEVERLVDGQMSPGYRRVPFSATGLASGVYLYRLTAGEKFTETGRVVLVK